MMKKLLLSAFSLLFAFPVFSQGFLESWILNGTALNPVNDSWTVGELTHKVLAGFFENLTVEDLTVTNLSVGSINFGFIEGSLGFADASGNLIENNPKIFWDNANYRLGIGTNTPGVSLETTGQITIGAYTLPNTDGSAGQVLKTDGGGAVAWGPAGGAGVESDPIYSGDPAFGIAAGDITNWDTAYGWGDWSVEDFAGIATADITNWDTAYGWGDHSGEGYLKNIVEDTTPQLGGELDVNGNAINATGADLEIKTTTSGDIYLNPAGNVGIGIATPDHKLEVKGTLNFEFTDLSGNRILVNAVDNDLVSGGEEWNVALGDIDGADSGAYFLVQTGDGTFQFMNGDMGVRTKTPARTLDLGGIADFRVGSEAVIDASSATYIAKIGDVDGAGDSTLFTLDDTALDIKLQATGAVRLGDPDNLGNGTDLLIDVDSELFIFTGGEVVIKDTAPSLALVLDVAGQIGGTEYCDENGLNCTAPTDLGLDGIYSGSGSLSGSTAVTMATNNLQFNSTGQVGLFTIDAVNDRVGIGMNNPAEELDVTGNIHASGTITSGSSITIDGANYKITSTGDIDLQPTGAVTLSTGKNIDLGSVTTPGGNYTSYWYDGEYFGKVRITPEALSYFDENDYERIGISSGQMIIKNGSNKQTFYFGDDGFVVGSDVNNAGGAVTIYGNATGKRAFFINPSSSYDLTLGESGLSATPDFIIKEHTAGNTTFQVTGASGNTAIAGVATVDTINEYTTDAGVTIEGVLIEDDVVYLEADSGRIEIVNGSFASNMLVEAGGDWIFTHDSGFVFDEDGTSNAVSLDLSDNRISIISGTDAMYIGSYGGTWGLTYADGTYINKLVTPATTAARTWTLPDATGTIALTSDIVAETDPIYSGDPAFGISAGDITNWDNAFGWGDHSGEGYLIDSNNLSDLTNAVTARTNLGLGTAAVADTGTGSGDVPILDGSGKLDTSILPALAITDVYVVADITARDALTVQEGDVAIVTDAGSGQPNSYIYDGSSWQELKKPADLVTSVNGDSGVVILDADDIADGSTYAIVSLTQETNWDTSYGWGDWSGEDFAGISSADITSWDTAYGWGDHSVAGYLSDVIDDGTPQLGGDLDVDGNSIVSASAGDIAITPDTTGDVILDGLKWPQADGTADYLLKTDGFGQLSWTASSGVESDPIYSGDPASGISSGDITNWDNAFGWGDHSTQNYYDKDTDDADDLTDGATNAIPTLVQETNWDSAYGWGDHSTQNYFDKDTDDADDLSDGVTNAIITLTQETNFSTAYGWGDHSGEGYLTGNESITLSGDVTGSGATAITTTIGADKVLETMLKVTNTPTDEYCLTYESTGTTMEWVDCGVSVESDPVYIADPAFGIAAGDITNWDSAYGWGDHSTQNYFDKDTDDADDLSDGSTNAIITLTQETNFETAYGWGDHSTQNYFDLDTDDADDLSDGATNAIVTLVQETNWDTAYGWGDWSGEGFLVDSNNLSDLTNAVTARTNLGLGTAAVADTGTGSGNIPILDGSGKLDTGVLPALAITDVYVVADITARDALTVQEGDVAIVTDAGSGQPNSYIYDGSSWQELKKPADLVTSVNGDSGVVILDADDIADGSTYAIVTLVQETNWDTAYGWGDHSIQNYFDTDTDDADDLSDGSTNAIVTLVQETNWDTAFGWGDWSGEDFAGISTSDISNWDTAYGWGDADPDQNLWETVAGDTGSTAANITTDTLTIAGGTSATTVMSGDTLTINVDDDFLLNDGDIGTGVYDFGGTTSFEITNSDTASPSVDGQIAFDNLVTDFTTGVLKVFGSGEEQGVVTMPIAQFTSPSDGYVVSYNATNDEFELVVQSGGGLTDVVDDTSPQLGGELDMNGNNISASNAAGAIIIDAAATATAPTLAPNKADVDTGLGWNAADQLSIIAGGVEIVRVVEDTVDQFIISPGALLGTFAKPSLAFGDGDSGFFQPSDNQISLVLSGQTNYAFTPGYLTSNINDSFYIERAVATATNPVYTFQDDTNTGIGKDGADSLSFITGGNENLLLVSAASAVNEVTITNAATGNAPSIAATGSNTDISLILTPKAAGDLVLDGLNWPQADGTTDYVLKTDGAGQLSWTAQTGGGGDGIYGGSGSLSAGTVVTMGTNDLQFDTTGQTGMLSIDATNDRVGIGTTSGPSYKLHVEDDFTAARTIYANATAATGVNYGVYARTLSTSGTGITGRAEASTGYTYGVKGSSSSTTNAYGVLASVGASTGVNFGVHSTANSTSGTAIYGTAPASTGSTTGVYGTVASTTGIGVRGEATNATGTNYGIYGSSAGATGIGVYGTAADSTSQNTGVYGRASGSSGRGVYAWATSATGSVRGLEALTTSPDGMGVYGRAESATGTSYAVYGRNLSSGGAGIYGWATSASGSPKGVYGRVTSADGYAGYFQGGRNYFEGNVGIGKLAPGAQLEVDGTVAYTPSSTQVLVAGTALTVTNHIMRIDSGAGGAVTMTATPTIDDGIDGECVIIQGDDDSNTVKFQDEAQLANTGLQLSGGADFTFGVGDTLHLCFDSGDDNWYEISRSDN